MSKPEIESLHSAIRQILLTDWDPSDASRSEAARGAYDVYIVALLSLIQSDAGEESIIDFLYDREHEFMCFPGLGKQRLRRVAQKLLALRTL